MAEALALLSRQKTVYNFPFHERDKDRRFDRILDEPDEPYHSIQEIGIQRAHVEGFDISGFG
jgi:hypothetical protein